MARTNRIFKTEVVEKRNFAALDEVYTADARILPPGAPMIAGREGIRKFWSDAVAAMSPTTADLESVEVNEAGDGLVEIGRATIDTPAGQVEAKYVVYWRQEEARWKWHIDIWNMNA